MFTPFADSATYLENTMARAMFVLPPSYPPPLAIVREFAVAPGPRFLSPEAAWTAMRPLRGPTRGDAWRNSHPDSSLQCDLLP